VGVAVLGVMVTPTIAAAETIYLTARQTTSSLTADTIYSLDTVSLVQTTILHTPGSDFDSLVLDTAGRIVYDVENTAQLRRVNTNGSGDTFIGGTGQTPKDMVLDPGGATVTLSENNSNDTARFLLSSGARTPLTNYGTNAHPDGLAYDNTGRLFGNLGIFPDCPAGQEKVYNINPANGAINTSSACTTGSFDGLTFDAFTGLLYATTFDTGHIFSINPNTLTLIDLGFQGAVGGPSNLDGIASNGKGLLYFIARNDAAPDTNQVRTFNILTGTSSLLKTIPGLDDVALGPVAVPEAGSLVLFGSGLLLLTRRRLTQK